MDFLTALQVSCAKEQEMCLQFFWHDLLILQKYSTQVQSMLLETSRLILSMNQLADLLPEQIVA